MRLRSVFVPVLLSACAPDLSAPDVGVRDRSEAPDLGQPLDAQDPGSGAFDAGLQDVTPRAPAIQLWSGRPGEEVQVSAIVYGAPVSIRVIGLEPQASYRLRGQLWGYASQAVFESDNEGEIDSARDAPVMGDYSGVDPEGLIWSMLKYTDAWERNYDVRIVVERDDLQVATATLTRHPMGYDTVQTRVREDGLVGTLLTPRESGPKPVVIVLGGSEGGLSSAEFQAAYLSTFGVSALALAYFGTETLPRNLARIPVEYVHTAVRWLERNPTVDGEQIYLWGASRGSELALMAAATSTAIRGVIAQVPSHVRWGSVASDAVPAWSYLGAQLPYLRLAPGARPATEMFMGQIAYRYAAMFLESLRAASPEVLEPTRIEVEAIRGRVVLIGGSDDGIWPSCAMAEAALERLESSGHARDYRDASWCLEGAGHALGPPGWPTGESYAAFDPALGGYVVYGGTAAGTARAQRQLYWILDDFFDELR